MDLFLNESQLTVTIKIWDLGPGNTSPAFYGPRHIEFEAVKEDGPSMLLGRKIWMAYAKRELSDQNLQEAPHYSLHHVINSSLFAHRFKRENWVMHCNYRYPTPDKTSHTPPCQQWRGFQWTTNRSTTRIK